PVFVWARALRPALAAVPTPLPPCCGDDVSAHPAAIPFRRPAHRTPGLDSALAGAGGAGAGLGLATARSPACAAGMGTVADAAAGLAAGAGAGRGRLAHRRHLECAAWQRPSPRGR